MHQDSWFVESVGAKEISTLLLWACA